MENIPGVLKESIEKHQDAAMISLIVLSVLGISSLVAIYLTCKNSKYIKRVANVTLFLSIISFSLITRTGFLGGQIRHTELLEVHPISAQYRVAQE